ncbi:hypothetical protein T484DRAFT_1894807 [Baffinella frigidus]|nr:hypothetical protein T484DRAFT_1894807 [Cryptophyta sp. CCMP2293]
MRFSRALPLLLFTTPLYAWAPLRAAPYHLPGVSRKGFRCGLLLRLAGGAMATSASTCAPDEKVQSFINTVNTGYESVHKRFEEQFWGTKMALPGGTKLSDGVAVAEFSVKELTRTKQEMEGFLADAGKLAETRAMMNAGTATPEQLKVLNIFEKTFKSYIMESDEAKQEREKATVMEGVLEDQRNKMKLGATLPGQGFVEMSSVGLRNTMRTAESEEVRKACFEGLRTIGPFVLENGFLDIVKARNRMAKALGFEDYYDMKVTQAEGFSKKRLFEMLDTLETGTGDAALQPWNTGYLMAGDVTRKLDPYFPFEKAVEMWGRSFKSLGITYKGSSMDLDLLDRQNKYSNGFCHWPQPAWLRADGTWQPATTHFTSLADPSAIGSGHTALTTLMHEAGHAAHFANIAQV